MLKSKTKDTAIVLGILGGGQLAKMLANSAYRLGINVSIIENSSDSPAGDMTKLDFSNGWNNPAELDKFIDSADIITLESEFIDPQILEYIAKSKPVFPSADTLKLVQDKFIQKQTFSNAGISVPYFEEINSIADGIKFGNENGFPFLIKTRTLGYDGYGNYTVKSPEDMQIAWDKFSSDGKNRKLMAEKFVNFTKELAVMVARNHKGELAVYPCVETIQKDHICHTVIAEAEIDPSLRIKAQELAVRCVESINGVGVFGIELFVTANGEVLVNEIAPRPHNSGHYTIEACYCSQFENAIRAICDLPLGNPQLITGGACMVNLLGMRDGSGVPTDVSKSLAVESSFLHLYNKKQSRKGRKMGHITALGKDPQSAYQTARRAADELIW